ncbi:MAG: hypothetical protein ACRDG5_12140 [Anaerolineales bacterium]
MTRVLIQSALATSGSLMGGMLLGFIAGSAVHGIPFHMPEQTRVVVASLPALAGVLGGGALWGMLLARIFASPAPRRMAAAGALFFGPTVLVTAILLSALEVAVVEGDGGPSLPVHIIFTLLFVPATFVVTSIASAAMLVAAGRGRMALRSALSCGLAGAGAFLGANLILDLLGWRVGAPGAAEKATMLTVLSLGSLAASFAGGGVLGVFLTPSRRPANGNHQGSFVTHPGSP